MSAVYKERRHKLAATLESLKVQGLGLLNRGEVTDEELNAFKDVGETLLGGTDYTLLGGENVSGVDAATDLELTLESLVEIIENLDDEEYVSEPTSEDEEPEVIRELIDYRNTMESLKNIGLALSKQEREDAQNEADSIEAQADGDVGQGIVGMLFDILSTTAKEGAKLAGKGLAKGAVATGKGLVAGGKAFGKEFASSILNKEKDGEDGAGMESYRSLPQTLEQIDYIIDITNRAIVLERAKL